MSTISLESELVSILNDDSNKPFGKEEIYTYTSVFLSKVRVDDTNPRFLPVQVISNADAYQFSSRQLSKKQLIKNYDAEGKVIIGKGCLINCIKVGTIEWKKANVSIESIIELAENIAVAEVIQVPTIYPDGGGYYKVLTGHRRFLSMIFNDGVDGAAHFKVYESRPLLLKTKQFQENSSREELPQYGKLLAFQDALREVEVLNTARLRVGKKALTVKETASLLGISMGAYDNYNVLTRYRSVISSYENGNTISFVQCKKVVLNVEKSYKSENNKKILNANDKLEINRLLEAYFSSEKNSKSLKEFAKPTSSAYRINDIRSKSVLRTFLTYNVCDIECGVDWNSLDWDNSKEVNSAIKKVITHLSNLKPDQ